MNYQKIQRKVIDGLNEAEIKTFSELSEHEAVHLNEHLKDSEVYNDLIMTAIQFFVVQAFKELSKLISLTADMNDEELKIKEVLMSMSQITSDPDMINAVEKTLEEFLIKIKEVAGNGIPKSS